MIIVKLMLLIIRYGLCVQDEFIRAVCVEVQDKIPPNLGELIV